MKTNKRKMQITYRDKFGEEGSIIQIMSEKKIGMWVCYFIDHGSEIVGVKEIADGEEVEQ